MSYQNSIARATVMTATKDQLQIRIGYTKGAVEAHKRDNNQEQVAFFEEELALIEKLLGLNI